MTKTATETPVDQSTDDDETQAQADFDAGAAMETTVEKTPPRDDAGRFVSPEPESKAAKKPVEKPTDPPAETPPEYIQLTKQQFERLEAAANRTDDHEKQFSKVFGTVGDVQKIVRTLQGGTPRGVAVKIPADAFAAMEKDFPEVAQHMRVALEATLKGMEGTGGASATVDTEAFERKVEERVLRLASEDLEDQHPDWQKIVGAVAKGEKPDPNNAFRKWLATKDKPYQDRINGTTSAGVITRAINAFKSESKTAPAAAVPDSRAQARASRIQDAVRPKGDGGQPPVKSADDDFESGFRTG